MRDFGYEPETIQLVKLSVKLPPMINRGGRYTTRVILDDIDAITEDLMALDCT